jgi:hypothetical protein
MERVLIGLAIVAVACGTGQGETSSASGSSGESTNVDSSATSSDESTTSDTPSACVDAGWDTSLAAYEMLAEQAGGTYWYALLEFEYIDDFQWACSYRTTIEIVAGAPVRRSFELAEVREGHTADDCSGVPFVEEAAEVGAMDAPYVAPIRTMEELYAGCCELLALEPPDSYMFHFDLDDDGVVAACYAIENDCGEGCEVDVDGFSGFAFETFAFGSP